MPKINLVPHPLPLQILGSVSCSLTEKGWHNWRKCVYTGMVLHIFDKSLKQTAMKPLTWVLKINAKQILSSTVTKTKQPVR